MLFRVMKEFTANGKKLGRGELVELEPSLKVQTLVSSRFLLPQDPQVDQVSKTTPNEAADNAVKRQQKRSKQD